MRAHVDGQLQKLEAKVDQLAEIITQALKGNVTPAPPHSDVATDEHQSTAASSKGSDDNEDEEIDMSSNHDELNESRDTSDLTTATPVENTDESV